MLASDDPCKLTSGFEHNENVLRVQNLIRQMTSYCETKHYVFVHGWMPLTFENGSPSIAENWRPADEKLWKEARELEWQQTYDAGLILPDKIIVCDHRPTGLAHQFDCRRYADDTSIFYGKGMIAIDGAVNQSGRVNVLVVEDDLLNIKHQCH